MKQYLIFAGDYYYPSGGWDDFQGSYDTLDKAKRNAPMTRDWGHIVNSQANCIVAKWIKK